MNEPKTLQAELLIAGAAELGEGPVWDDQTRTLLWVDIPHGLVHRFDPHTGSDASFPVGQPVGAVAVRESGGLVLAVRDGFALLEDDRGEPELVCDVERHLVGSRMNDGKCDRAGRFWAGTMALDYRPGAGTLYRLEPDLSFEAVRSEVTISNGLAWSADDRTLYFVDSAANGIDAFDFDLERGTIDNCRRLVEIPVEEGLPDGMTIDVEGCLWVALWDGWAVRRYRPDGTLDVIVDLPVAQVTSCAFGGEHLDELYVTTACSELTAEQCAAQPHAGGLFRVRPAARGLPAARFGG